MRGNAAGKQINKKLKENTRDIFHCPNSLLIRSYRCGMWSGSPEFPALIFLEGNAHSCFIT